jgi:hypothetical protein
MLKLSAKDLAKMKKKWKSKYLFFSVSCFNQSSKYILQTKIRYYG